MLFTKNKNRYNGMRIAINKCPEMLGKLFYINFYLFEYFYGKPKCYSESVAERALTSASYTEKNDFTPARNSSIYGIDVSFIANFNNHLMITL